MSAFDGNFVLPLGQRSLTPNVIAPDGSEIRFSVDASQGATKSSVVEVTLAPGEVTRPVRHQTVEEIWHVLEGAGQVWRCPPGVPPETVTAVSVSTGDALVIPTGWAFQFAAASTTPFRFLCHTTPPWPGENEAVLLEYGGLGGPTV